MAHMWVLKNWNCSWKTDFFVNLSSLSSKKHFKSEKLDYHIVEAKGDLPEIAMVAGLNHIACSDSRKNIGDKIWR